MKKILLSVAVIAASGAYVGYEDYTGAGATAAPGVAEALPVLPGEAPAATAAIVPPKAAPASGPAAAEAAPVDAATPRVPVSPRAPVTVVQAALPASRAIPASNQAAPSPAPGTDSIDVAQLAPADPAPQPATPPATAATALAPVEPMPLPRPRPADAPAAPLAVADATTAANPQGRYVDGTYKGVSANAYYGRVQIAAVIRNGQITNVKILQYPNDRRTSRYINSQALPMLMQETIQAQSAQIDAVSGATLTSGAFMQSLDSALAKAGGNHA